MKEPKIYVGGVPVVLILGTAMLVAGLYYIYMEAVSFAPEYKSELVMASYAVVLMSGIWIIYRRDMESRRSVYICGMALGIATILQNLFFMSDDEYGYDFFLGFFTILLGVAEMAFSVAYLFQYRNVVNKLLILSGVQVLMVVIPIFMKWYSGEPLDDIIVDYYTTFPMIAVHVIYMWILTREGIWVPSPVSKIEKNLVALEDMLHTDRHMYMTPSDLDVFLDSARWKNVYEGPVERETVIELRGEDHSVRMLVQKMKGDDVPHAAVFSGDTRQFVQGFRFDMVDVMVAEDRGSVKVYGYDGMFVRILVRDPPVKKGARSRMSEAADKGKSSENEGSGTCGPEDL